MIFIRYSFTLFTFPTLAGTYSVTSALSVTLCNVSLLALRAAIALFFSREPQLGLQDSAQKNSLCLEKKVVIVECCGGVCMPFLSPIAWLVLAILVCVELAVLVPVITIQKAHDDSLVNTTLRAQTDDLAARVNRSIAAFMYNVVRAAAAAPTSGFLSQQALEDAIQLQEDPINTPATLYFWVPLVSNAERMSYEQFYGFNITQLRNGSTTLVTPVPDSPGRIFAPYTIFVPRLPPPPTTNPAIYGFDLLSFPTTAPVFRNASKFLVIPSGLVNRTQNNYGFVAVAQNKYGKGYMFGRIGSRELLEFSLVVPRRFVTLAAYVVTTNASRQALFYDDTPLLGNATNLAIFNSLPARSEFVVSTFTSFGEVILVAVRYDGTYAAQFAGNTWVILAAVLAPVCFLIDVIWIVLAMLWERRKQLLALEQQKRQEAHLMISYVNHEIRNPLQTILGLADINLERAEDEGNHLLANDMGSIVRAAEFMEHIATDILDLRRVEEGKLELEITAIDVDALVNGLRRAVEPLRLHKRDVEFDVRVDNEIKGTIHTDRYRLEQILLNFLTNAFKHTNHGVVTFSVGLYDALWARFAVADTGKGIDLAHKDRLFQQFSQVSTRDATDLGGFGLGLHLAKMLAHRLGGRVGFDSQLGVGSVFWVDLPVRPTDTCLTSQFEQTEIRLT